MNEILRNINYEFQRFIDVELKRAIQEMKNDLYEQEMGFEREILASLEKAHRDLEDKMENFRPKQQDKLDSDKYALKNELAEVANTMMSAQKHLEDV